MMRASNQAGEKLTFEGIELIFDVVNDSGYYSVVCKQCGTVSSCQPDGHGLMRYCAWCNQNRMHGYVYVRKDA
jgi:hypothetical protein